MAYISDEHRFAYFAAPATGSSAVIKALADAGIGQYWPEADVIDDDRRVAPVKHTTLPQLKDAALSGRIEGYVRAVGTRNVFSWHVAKFLRNKTKRQRTIRNKKSWVYTELTAFERARYIEHIEGQKDMSFAEYLRSLLDDRSPIDHHAAFHADMDVYLHQERLRKEFNVFARRVGLPPELRVTPFNVTGAMEEDETYRDYYTPELVDLVYEKNAPFFETFPEYSFEGYDPSKARA